MVLCPHYGMTFNPVRMLGLGRIGPVVKRDRPQNSSVDDCLGEGWVQPPSEQKDRSLGILFPLCNFSEVVECRDVSVEILSLHLDG